MQKKYANVARFIAVYLAEAHAMDEWPIGDRTCVTAHKTIEERADAARQFTKDYNFEVTTYLDTMINNFDFLFGAWPERFFIISAEKQVLVAGQPNNEFGYDRQEIENALNIYQNKLVEKEKQVKEESREEVKLV